MTAKPNGPVRHDTPVYALRSELEALRTFVSTEAQEAREDAARAQDHAFRANARAEWLENLMNGLEERLARRVAAQIELHLSPLAAEMAGVRQEVRELRMGVYAANETAKGAEAIARTAERASGTNEDALELAERALATVQPVVAVAAQRSGESMRARDDNRRGWWALVGWLTAGGGAVAIGAALMKACGG